MVKRSTTKALKAVRKSKKVEGDTYEEVRAKSYDEFVTYVILTLTEINRTIREDIEPAIEKLKIDYKNTNERQVNHENSSRHLPKIPNLYAHEDQL